MRTTLGVTWAIVAMIVFGPALLLFDVLVIGFVVARMLLQVGRRPYDFAVAAPAAHRRRRASALTRP